MKMTCYSQSWPIAGSFTISRGSKTHADVVVVELQHNGVVGRGESVPYARYGESIEQSLQELQQVADKLTVTSSAQDIQTWLPSGAARNALDCAWWDLQCKQQQKSINQLLNLEDNQSVITAFTLSLDTPEKMAQVAAKQQNRPLLKLKLAGEGDIERVAAVRRNAPNATIIVDANEGWDIDLYHRMVPKLVELNVAMIEQPFPADKDAWLDGLERPICLCADESCHDRSSLESVLGRYDMVNIKLDKTGGLTEALALKQAALESGLQIMVGCMVATSLAMAPAFVVAQGVDVVDLDGPLLLAEDREFGFEFDVSQMLPFTSQLWG